MTPRWLSLALWLAAGGAAAAEPPKPPPAPVAPPPAPAPKRASKADLARWTAALDKGSEAEMLTALREIAGFAGGALAARPLVEKRLGRGANVAVVLEALQTAGKLGAAESSAAVAPYVQHRHPDIRKAAARTLALTKGPVAVAALRRALAGPDPAVRAVAAEGLGVLGAREAVDDLFTVLERDTPEAALAIARLCSPEQCDRLMKLVGRLRFEVLEPGFLPLLLRPAASLPDANKLRYIDQLRRLATRRAAVVLETALASLPADASAALQAGLREALQARPVVGDP